LKALKGAGDQVDGSFVLVGLAPITPLVYAVSFEDARVVEALLDAGAKLDQTDDDGLTPLSWAAIGNRVGDGAAMIARGRERESRRQARSTRRCTTPRRSTSVIRR
jgi:ankyrin repeat protein